MRTERKRAVLGKYEHGSILQRIEAFLLDNVGRIATK
jgi:hypothetical protein